MADFREWNHQDVTESTFSGFWSLVGKTTLFLLSFWLFFLLEVLCLDFFSTKLSWSRILFILSVLLFPFSPWELSELENSGKTLLPTEFSSTRKHDSNCMDGSTEKRRNIVSISKLVNAYPPDKLPNMPPKAIANQDIDWRSPANEALVINDRCKIWTHIV